MSVTVPGAAAAWDDALTLFGSGKLSLADVLQPAIDIAERGFYVGPWMEHMWREGAPLLTRSGNSHGKDLLVGKDDLSDIDSDADARSSSIVWTSPQRDDLFVNPKLANVLKSMALQGVRKTFYDVESEVVKSIVEAVQKAGGLLTPEDMANYETEVVTPIYVDFRACGPEISGCGDERTTSALSVGIMTSASNGSAAATADESSATMKTSTKTTTKTRDATNPSCPWEEIRLWEIPPNGQGIAALIGLNILEYFVDELKTAGHNSTAYLHILVEAVRLAFADTLRHCADQRCVQVPISTLLSKSYASSRAKLIRLDSVISDVESGIPCEGDESMFGTDTVYFCAADETGNACSFINSNYMGFGSGIVPENAGFTLQNRGSNFSLKKGHNNCVAPNKRPYHTIIPAMLTTPSKKSGKEEEDLLAVFGVMGGFMQPQGHIQVVLNMALFGMDPQRALDASRFCIGPGHSGAVGGVSLEEGIEADVIEGLRLLGHETKGPIGGFDRTLFGRGHLIQRIGVDGGAETGADMGADENKVEGPEPPCYSIGCETRSDGISCGY